MKKISVLFLILTLMTSVVFAEQAQQKIQAIKNTIQVTLNGEKVVADNLLYEGRTYVQLKEISNMIDATLTWNDLTKTANLEVEKNTNASSTPSSSKTITLNEYINPLISYTHLGTTQQSIFGVAFGSADNSLSYELTQTSLQIYGNFSTNTQLEIIVIKKDNSLLKRTLVGGELPKVQREDNFQVVFIPANLKSITIWTPK